MKSIAFDLDGTLLSVGARDYAIYSDILADLGYKALEESFYWSLRRCKYNIVDLVALTGFTNKEHLSIFFNRRNEMMESSHYLSLDTIHSDVVQTIQDLRINWRCVIVTTRYNVKETKKQINLLGLDSLFDDVIISSQNKKDSFASVKDLYAIVGDTENDIFPAKELNIISIGVSTGIRSRALLQLMQPSVVIENLSDLKTIL